MEEHLCAICLENLHDGQYLFMLDACNHLYHYSCISKYVEKYKHKSLYCPVCRTNFKSIGFEKSDLNIVFNKNCFNENDIVNKLPRECLIYENLPISEKLAEFLNVPNKCLSNRFIITKKLYKYIHNNKLICDNENKINCDDKLYNLFIEELTENNSNILTYLDIQTYLCNHISHIY